MLKLACICPHPTAIIPEDENGANSKIFKKTLSSYNKLADEIKKIQPENLVVISPFGPMRYDKFTINLEEKLVGNFQNFGVFDNEFETKNNIEINRQIIRSSRTNHLPIELIREFKIDYATLIILHYLNQKISYKPSLIPLTFTVLDLQTHFFFGQLIGKVLEDSDQSFAVVASGDLSRRLSESSPAGYSPYGEKLDKAILELFKKDALEEIVNLNPEFYREAEEVGLKSIAVLTGIISIKKRVYQELSYESPMGTGHLTAHWKLR